ncbi:MAG: MMPL family transporter, partial [Desulfobacterales bacterium]
INFYLLTLALLIPAALFAAGLYRTKIDTDIVSSLPHNNPVISDGLYIIKNHPIQNNLLIDISHQKNDLDILVECGLFVEKKLKRSGLFKSVGMKDAQSLIPDLLFYIVNNLPVMFSENELKNKIEPLLDKKKIQKKLADFRSRLFNIESIGRAELIIKDPLGLKDLVMAKLAYLSPSQNVRIYKRQLISSDGKHLLLMADPITSSTETSFSRRAAELIHTVSLEVKQKYSKTEHRFALTPVGAYRVALDNELIARKDVRNAILFSMIGITLLLIFTFPRPYIGLLSLLPAVAGTMVAFFVYSFFHKTVSLMVLGFGGAIISISVDHAIAYLLFLDRPYTTYGREASKEIRAVGLLAVLTTAGAFAVLTISGFPILKQLGQFTALGISFSFIFVHTVFPIIFPEMPPARPRALALQNMVNRFALTGKTGALCALIFALFMLFFARPRFNVSLSSMNTVSSETAAAENLVSNVWGKLSNKIFVMTEGKSIDDLQKKGDRLLAIFDHDIHPDILSPGFIPSMIFPGKERRRQNFAAWQNFWNRIRVSTLKKRIKTVSLDLGFTEDAFDSF